MYMSLSYVFVCTLFIETLEEGRIFDVTDVDVDDDEKDVDIENDDVDIIVGFDAIVVVGVDVDVDNELEDNEEEEAEEADDDGAKYDLMSVFFFLCFFFLAMESAEVTSAATDSVEDIDAKNAGLTPPYSSFTHKNCCCCSARRLSPQPPPELVIEVCRAAALSLLK